jgi:hypothetical protein
VSELTELMRWNKRSKARLLDVVCERDHRLVEVFKVARRPLALGIDTTIVPGDQSQSWRHLPTSEGWAPDRRGRWLGLWLDVNDGEDPAGSWAVTTTQSGDLHVVQQRRGPVERYTFICARRHCSEPISLAWLRKQLELAESSRRRRVVIDDKIRYAIRQELES